MFQVLNIKPSALELDLWLLPGKSREETVTQLWFQHPPVAADVKTADHNRAIVLSVVEQVQHTSEMFPP